MPAPNRCCNKSPGSDTWSAENFAPCRAAHISTIRLGKMAGISSAMSQGTKFNHYAKPLMATAASSN